jgi:hypothetical protein
VHFDGAGRGIYNEAKATTCDITGTDCYKARIVPSITSINLSSGYTTGGQELIIEGHALDADDSLEVTVGDTPCIVKDFSRTQIRCETSATTLPSEERYVGSNGLYHAQFNQTKGANANNYKAYLAGDGVEQEGEEFIMTSFEIPTASHYWSSYDHINGFFEAPVDGLYQFHMSCDDWCTFYMGSG